VKTRALRQGPRSRPWTWSCALYAGPVTQAQHPAPGYFLGADETERARLRAQGEVHLVATEALLEPLDGRVVDFGCGPLGVLDMLSRRVGPVGEPAYPAWDTLLFQAWGRKPG
jgi:hypothetical protein